MPRLTPKNPTLVADVKALLAEKLTYTQIAERLDITRSMVSGIVRRWIKGIPDPRGVQERPAHIPLMLAKGEVPPPPTRALCALAEFDPVIARALHHRLALIAAKEKGAEAP